MIKKDGLGIIGQPNKHKYTDSIEGGDSMNWQGHLYYLTDFKNYDHYCSLFESPNYYGLYHRHPNPHQSEHGWASYCEGNFKGVESRDQMTGKLCFFVKSRAFKPLFRCFVQHLKRGLIFANNTIHNGHSPDLYRDCKKLYKLPDLTAFDIWALYIRGFRVWPLYPLLLVFDLHLLVDALLTRYVKGNDIISHVLKVTVSREYMPTPISWLASKVNTTSFILKKLHNYWCGWRDQCGMYDLYESYLRSKCIFR